ncbi:MAG: hypothetical protein HN646_08090, partial [Nitrospina sp.]|nr:hypothetical protein [Nitrospina sp.]
IKIDLQSFIVKVEVFNKNYFNYFNVSLSNVTLALEKILFTKLLLEKSIPEILRETAFSLLKNNEVEREQPPNLDLIKDHKVNLEEIFDKLNTKYFKSEIKATIKWGKKVNKKNLTSFRFGSYDPKKKLIRIHPRLQQDFVPISVLELTVYHEMCHQWAPMKRERGMWIAHHPQFKEKEREYSFYNEARSWEKDNWKKLMRPIRKKNIPDKLSAPIEQNVILKVNTLTG